MITEVTGITRRDETSPAGQPNRKLNENQFSREAVELNFIVAINSAPRAV